MTGNRVNDTSRDSHQLVHFKDVGVIRLRYNKVRHIYRAADTMARESCSLQLCFVSEFMASYPF